MNDALRMILDIAHNSAQVRQDGTRAVLAVLYDAMLEQARREFEERLASASLPLAERVRVARELCREDHGDSWDRPVLPPGMPPMIHRVPVQMYRAPLMDESRAGQCVDVGSLLGSGPMPLWVYYLEVVHRMMDARQRVAEEAKT